MDFLNTPIKNQFRWSPLHKCNYLIDPDINIFPNINLILPKKYIGIEVEVEKVPKIAYINDHIWNIKEDGSLRNSGLEFVSTPLCGNQIKVALQTLFTETIPIDADFSERTSIHIHINMRDSLCNELINLVLLYIVFERLFYKFAGPERYENIFCVPVQETKLPIAVANYLIYQDINILIREWQKYSGLNLAPLRNFGTVEYRHMKGHRDPIYLLKWINLIFRLHKYAKKNSFLNLFNYIKTLNSTSLYEEFIKVVFRDEADYLLSPQLKQDMEQGVSTVKSISLPSKFFTNLISNIENNSPLLKSIVISKTAVKPLVNNPLNFDIDIMNNFVPNQVQL